jgi:hypothetical protein
MLQESVVIYIKNPQNQLYFMNTLRSGINPEFYGCFPLV